MACEASRQLKRTRFAKSRFLRQIGEFGLQSMRVKTWKTIAFDTRRCRFRPTRTRSTSVPNTAIHILRPSSLASFMFIFFSQLSGRSFLDIAAYRWSSYGQAVASILTRLGFQNCPMMPVLCCMKPWAGKGRNPDNCANVMSAFAVAIGGKADMPFCTAHVR